ncbi:prepilin peptidase [Candidatus Woesearchaeota archaeon]|nr:prepilin peptidase [Candidatus Woesearchaeota archaeon]
MIIVLLAVCFVFLLLASYFDLKTREIPDWLNYGVIIFAIVYRLGWSLFSGDWSFLFSGLLGFGAAFLLACLLFYTAQWGGGDAKSLMGIGAILGLEISLNSQLIAFLVNLIFIGALYSIIAVIFIAFNNWNKVSDFFKKELMKNVLANIFLSTLIIIVLFFTKFNLEIKTFFLVLIPSLWFFYFFVLLTRSVEKTCMKKFVAPSMLTEGDWVVEEIKYKGKTIASPRGLGLTLEQINKLKKLNKKVWIKYGIPFLPSFLISFLVTVTVGNLLVYFLV